MALPLNSFNSFYDTPPNTSSFFTIANGRREMAPTLRDQTQAQARGHTSIVDLAEFVEKMCPIAQKDIDATFKKLKKDGVYKDKSWAGKPKDKNKALEAHYEAMFVNCAESIRATYTKLHPQADAKLLTKWLRFSHKSPTSFNKFASLLRPDVVLSLLAKEHQAEIEAALQEILELEDELAIDPTDDEKKSELKELVNKLSVLWTRINIVVEVKKVLKKGCDNPVIQLLTYMGQVLREQPDRRSTMGLLLCANDLGLWYMDRSGVVGTQTGFDIHKDPRLFIKVVLACSFCSPEQLGWDISMRLWNGSADPAESRHSFDPRVPPKLYKNPKRHWVIEMPGEADQETSATASASGATRTAYLTIEPISTSRTEIMFGRATVVWAVMKLEDIKVDDHNVHVLKQSWRPRDAPMEWDLIPKDAMNVNQVISAEEVSDDGVVVETLSYLRHDLSPGTSKELGQPADVQSKDRLKRMADRVDDMEHSNPHRLVFAISDINFGFQDPKRLPVPRVQTRTLLKEYGWPMKYFKDLVELLKVIEDCVRAQQNIYFDHGTLQRDVSLGNIIICPETPNDASKTKCRIIDFDYSKTTNIRVPSLLGLSATLPALDEQTQKYMDAQLQNYPDERVPPSIGRLALLYRVTFTAYDQAMSLLQPLSAEMDEALRLGFLSKETFVPDFRIEKQHLQERTGTAPFTSPEILVSPSRSGSSRIFHEGQPKPTCRIGPDGTFLEHEWRDYIKQWGERYLTWKQFSVIDNSQPAEQQRWRLICHDAIHDLESLFWVVTYICLTRGGPGGPRRQELQPGHAPRSEQEVHLCQMHASLYAEQDTDKLATFKTTLFVQNAYSIQISPYFHPYFSALKPLMDQWWQILHTAHKWPIFEGFFDYLLVAIASTSKFLSNTWKAMEEPEAANKSAEVGLKREKILKYLRSFPHHDKVDKDSERIFTDTSPLRPTGQKVDQSVTQLSPTRPPSKKSRRGKQS